MKGLKPRTHNPSILQLSELGLNGLKDERIKNSDAQSYHPLIVSTPRTPYFPFDLMSLPLKKK